MDMFRFLFYAFLAYLAFRLLFGFVIPLFRTTRQIRRGIREMQQHMNGMPGQSRPSAVPQPKPVEPGTTDTSGEYIEFEEIK
jgi:hypothetical protein